MMSKISSRAVKGLVLLASLGISALASGDTAIVWTQLAPPSVGGPVTGVAAQPGVDGTYLIATNTGLFLKTAASATWKKVLDGVGALQVAYDPANAQDAYATGGVGFQVNASTDGGMTWKGTAINVSGPSSDGSLSLAVDPVNHGVAYAGSFNGRVVRTANGGSSWTQANAALLDGEVNALAVDPANPTHLFAVVADSSNISDQGLYISTNSGSTWTQIPAFAGTNDLALGINADATHSIFVASSTVYISADHGSTFNPITIPLVAFAFAFDPKDPNKVYAATEGQGLYVSPDDGVSWSLASANTSQLSVSSLVVDPVTTSTLYAATLQYGMYASTDSGAAWTLANTGLDCAGGAGILISPTNPKQIFLTAGATGITVSNDGGSTWASANSGIPPVPSQGILVLDLMFKPGSTTSLYADALDQGFLVSTDGAKTWAQANTGLPAICGGPDVSAIAADPNHPDTVYAALALSCGGLFVTTNGGGSWSQIGAAWSGDEVHSIAVDPANSQILYMTVPIGTNLDQLQVSQDGGASWKPVGSSLPTGLIRKVLIDPVNTFTLYATVDASGVYKSVDGGATWTTNGPIVTDGLATLSMDPANHTTLYLGTNGGGVYVTNDGGSTWVQSNQGLDSTGTFDLFIGGVAAAQDTGHTLYAASASSKLYSTAQATPAPPPATTPGGSSGGGGGGGGFDLFALAGLAAALCRRRV